MTEPKNTDSETFARELDTNSVQHDCEELILAASPEFHGRLNKHLNKHMSAVVVRNIDKDYTQDDEQQLIKRLIDYL